ncbi:hypothetical protein L209DRAFT_340777 [Thermothelomyces heterothallicus CBS 203.75]
MLKCASLCTVAVINVSPAFPFPFVPSALCLVCIRSISRRHGPAGADSCWQLLFFFFPFLFFFSDTLYFQRYFLFPPKGPRPFCFFSPLSAPVTGSSRPPSCAVRSASGLSICPVCISRSMQTISISILYQPDIDSRLPP